MDNTVPLPRGVDENPEWTDADFVAARAASDVHGAALAGALVRPRGRPALCESERKVNVSIRLSPEVLAYFKADGAGWQTRINDALREAAGVK